MKKLLFTLFTLAACNIISAQYCGTSGTGQCTPTGGPVNGGFEHPDATPCIVNNTPYDYAIQFTMFTSINFQGQQSVDSMEFISIENLPCGLCWSLNQADKRYTANEDGCLRIMGTTTDAVGQYKLAVTLKMWINGQPTGLTVPASLVDQTGIKLFLKVQPTSITCPLADTSTNANNLTSSIVCGTGNAPVANFDWSIGPQPNRANFHDLSINNPTSWVWSFGDGSGSIQQNPFKIFPATGIYNVCLRATNAFGTSALVCKDVTITSTGTLTAQLPTQDVCANSQIIIQPQVAGGIPPYTYYWSGTGNTLSCTTCQNPQVTITQASAYTLTVVDATNVSATAIATYFMNPGTNNMQLSANSTTINCLNLVDTTSLTIVNGTAPFRIYWGDGDTLLANSSATHFYNEAGDFVITVADNSNCITSIVQNVPFDGITISALQTVQPTCQHDSSGKIIVVSTGGTAPYTFSWSNGAVTDSIVNVDAGLYTITVTDVTSCSFEKTFNLSPVSGWSYSAFLQPVNANCSSTGSIQTTITGGTPPFTFLWTDNSTSQNLISAAPGVFGVTITDALGCQTVGSATIASGCHSVISGTLFNDQNSNCIWDNGEQAVSNALVTATLGSQLIYGYVSANGNFNIEVPATGTYTLDATLLANPTCGNAVLCGGTSNVVISNLGDTSANNNLSFASNGGFDLTLRATWGPGNPGFHKTYTLYYHNQSPVPFTGQATLMFTYDDSLIYQSSSLPATHNIATHTLTWLIDTVPSISSWWQNGIVVEFLVPQNVSLGHLVHDYFRLEPTVGDCDSSNNSLFVVRPVTGSYDPNEKKVEPAGDIFEEDSVLTYEIGFQNTGTDSTHFIILKDTLSPYLDPATVRNIASSHPYSDFAISGTGILTWTFNPLRLVDSFTNEPESHGFVKFTIKKKKNLPLNTVISNTAHIYFDYNPAVVTNTVTNTLTEPNGIWHIRSTEGISVKAFPNPFSEGTTIAVEGLTGRYDFELYDVTGKLNNRIPSIETNRFYINRNNISAGIYFFKIISADKKKSGYGKLVVE